MGIIMKKKWTISFIAEKDQDRHDRKVVMRVNWDGNLVRFLVGYRVDCTPIGKKTDEKKWNCRWDWNKQRCKANTTHFLYKSDVINNKIQSMENKATSIFEKYLFGEENRLPTDKEFRNEFEGIKEAKKVTFFSVFDEFIETAGIGKGWTKAVTTKFRTIKKHLQEYNPNLTLDFSIDDANGFIQWYINKGYRNTTTVKNSAFIKWFLGWAYGKGYYKGNVHTSVWKANLKGVGSNNEIHFLEWEEVMQLWNFTPYRYIPNEEEKRKKMKAIGVETLQQVKDCFLFQCFTGLRYSDLAKLTKTNIDQNYISIVTQKTSDKLKIDLNEFSRAILEKYKNIPFKNDLALPVISNQRMNLYLKILCKEAGINSVFSEVFFVGTERHEVNYQKWERIGTHTGRRTFVVTSLTLGIDPLVVMKWTGHSDLREMEPYIAIVDKKKQESANKFDELFKKI